MKAEEGEGLEDYWKFIKPSLRPLEREIQQLSPDVVRVMDGQQWYTFLLEKYFVWKYTAPNRYASTTGIIAHLARRSPPGANRQ